MKHVKTEVTKKVIEPREITITLTNDELNYIVAAVGIINDYFIEDRLRKYKLSLNTDGRSFYKALKDLSDLKD